MKNQEPRAVDLFSDEMEKFFKSKGVAYERKIVAVRGAQRLSQSRTVETTLPDGTIETIVDAKPGDWIVTGPEGERFVLNSIKFANLYLTDDKGGYIPKEHKIIALKNPFVGSVKITAPWGTPEVGGEECYFVVTLDKNGNFTNDRYIIGNRDLLLQNYRLI